MLPRAIRHTREVLDDECLCPRLLWWSSSSLEESSHDLIDEGLVLAHLLLCLGCGLVWTNFHKVPQLVASIASSLSLLISLIGENKILDLDGHTLDIEPLNHLLHLVD